MAGDDDEGLRDWPAELRPASHASPPERHAGPAPHLGSECGRDRDRHARSGVGRRVRSEVRGPEVCCSIAWCLVPPVGTRSILLVRESGTGVPPTPPQMDDYRDL